MEFKRHTPIAAATRTALLCGFAAAALFFGGFGAWSAMAPIASAAIAPGTVTPEGSRRVVQHLEGGIISEIRVTSGSKVEAGDVLVVLEGATAKATYDAIESRLIALRATEARLIAERDGLPKPRIPAELIARAAKADTPESIDSQLDLFETRRKSYDANQTILDARIDQYRQEIAGLEDQIAALERQLALIDQEEAGQRELFEKGFSIQTRLLALQRAQASLGGDIAKARSDIARTERAIGETKEQKIKLSRDRLNEVVAKLAEVQAEIEELRERRTAAADVLARLKVRAPVSGTVIGLRFRTRGGVVPPGGAILDLVPDHERLVLEVKVHPNDIDRVHPGLTAQVTFPAFDQRNLPRLTGTVIDVSADRLESEDGNEAWYRARVEVAAEELGKLGAVALKPGMAANAFIVTGEQTLLDYIMRPITESLSRSFREA